MSGEYQRALAPTAPARTDAISIVVNGEPREIAPGASLLDLLSSLDLYPRVVVVEHNRQIVRRPSLDAVRLMEGDRVELVHFVGGG